MTNKMKRRLPQLMGIVFLFVCSHFWIIRHKARQSSLSVMEAAKSRDSRRYFDLLVIVPTVSNAQKRRTLLRKQFARTAHLMSGTVLLLFVMSEKEEARSRSKSEASHFGDILFVPCSDIDNGMPQEDSSTTCKVLKSIQYVHQHYAFSFLARVGDDAYFRFDYFWNEVRHRLPQGPTYTGRFLVNGKVWEPHLQEHLGLSLYPPYASGMGYVLSSEVVDYIAVASKTINFRSGYPEDAVVGLWLVGVQLRRYHTLEFHNAPGAQYGSKPCTNESILIHYMTQQLWDSIDNAGRLFCR